MSKETLSTNIFDYSIKGIKREQLRTLYEGLLKPRLIEEKMLSQLRQGKISKWFAGIGQEAIAVGATEALKPEEYIFTMHRNLGVFTTRDVPLYNLFCQWQGKSDGFTNGRDRSFHFGLPDYHIIGMISHVAAMLSVADGVGLAHRLSDEQKVALAFTGEGATSEGEFHEAVNIAAVWDLPVIFLIENNSYALSTPVEKQYKCEKLSDRGVGYGIEGQTINGNNILEVYRTVRDLAQSIRENPRPVLLECDTFRMRGHEEASGTDYVPDELFEKWGIRDPVKNFEQFLLKEEVLSETEVEETRQSFKDEIKTAWDKAYDQPDVKADKEKELGDVFATAPDPTHSQKEDYQELRLIDAVSEGLNTAMQKHDDLVLMGQDIAEHGGVFRVTEGFVEEYGKERVRNTPLCEAGVIGTGLGLSLEGYKSVIEMQFADFVSNGFNQVVNNLAKTYYRWQHPVDVVVRMPTGGGVGAGPFHSQSNEAWFCHVPGLKVVYPSTAMDAKGLLLAAIEDPNPVLYFEHKFLYRSVKDEVPADYYTTPIGQAQRMRKGKDVSIITYGWGVQWALDTVEELGVAADIVDLRTLSPYDKETIRESVIHTSKAIVLHEACLSGGLGGEIAGYIAEHLFEHLDGPVLRCGSLDTPVPFAKPLENQFLARQEFREKLKWLVKY